MGELTTFKPPIGEADAQASGPMEGEGLGVTLLLRLGLLDTIL